MIESLRKKSRYIVVFRKDMFWRCWLTEAEYGRIGPVVIHRWCKSGEGNTVRHLCGNSHCINPLHHRNGTQSENGRDRGEKESYIRWFFRDMTNDEKDAVIAMHDRLWRKIPHFGMYDVCNLIYADHVVNNLRQLAKYGYIWDEQKEFAKEVFKTIINDPRFKLIIMENYFNEYTRA